MGVTGNRQRRGQMLLCLTVCALLGMTRPGFGLDPSPVLLETIAADVGGEPITLRETLIYCSLLQGRVVGLAEKEILRDALPRLVEQEIIRQEVAYNPDFSPSQSNLTLVLQSFIDHAGGAAGFSALLDRLQVEEGELQEIVENCSRSLDFVDTRFRPFVYVLQEDARKYYTDEFLPALPPEAPIPPFDSVSDRLTLILEEKKVNEEFFNWLEQRKKEMKIKILLDFQD